MHKKTKVLVGDFETTVYEGQIKTEVWASAIAELFEENAIVFNSISSTFDYLKSLKSNVIIYYQNLKFDGNFWLSYLIKDLKFKQAIRYSTKEGDILTEEQENKFFNALSDEEINIEELTIPKVGDWDSTKDMLNNTFKYVLSDRGQWYSITIKVGGHKIEIRDSYKLLPFSVKKIGRDFKTKHQKTSIEYKGYREAGGKITEQEEEYIKNDVYVIKEALEIMYNEGHDKLTIGSCCLSEYKLNFTPPDSFYDSPVANKMPELDDITIYFDKKNKDSTPEYKLFFPDMYSIEIDREIYGEANAGEYIRHSYKGGWCYLVKGKENQIKHNGTTADVNSLYPSMMHSESGNVYPIGKPTFWHGDYIPDEATDENKYFFHSHTY